MAWSEAAISYFAERAIDPDVAVELGVRQNGAGIEFPYPYAEAEMFSRTRSLNGAGPKVRQPRGTTLCLWHPGHAGFLRDVLVCEGESDLLASISALRRAPVRDLRHLPVVAIPGTGFPAERVVQHLTDNKCQRVWLALDADDAGRKYTALLAPLLVDKGIKVFVINLVAGCDVAASLAAEAEDQRGDWIANVLVDSQAAGEEEAPLVEAGQHTDATPADTAELLDEVKTFVCRFVVLPTEETADLIALWVLHSHAFEASWATPYLRIVSAAPNSGKTLLMEVLAAITRRGWHAINPSVAVLYRKVDRQQPTLLLDEMDNYPIDDRRDALSVLNAGYKRGATVDRCKDSGDLEAFDVYCPKAFAGIDARALVDTLLSRSITIRMEKKISTEIVDRWIAPLVEPDAIRLRERCEAWAAQHVEVLTDHDPDLLGLINRQAEVWWALLSIAEHAGTDWTGRARHAAKQLTTGGDDTDDVSAQVQILLDIKDAFGTKQTAFTKDLLVELNKLDESPWGARRKGEGLDARGLARMLRPFKIKPRTVRVEGTNGTSRGYHLDQFSDAFARHLPKATQATQATQPAPHIERDVSDVSDVSDFEGCAHEGLNSEGRTPAGLELEARAMASADDETSRFIRGETDELGRPADWTDEAAADFITKATTLLPGSTEEAGSVWRPRPGSGIDPTPAQCADPAERTRLWREHGVKWFRTPPPATPVPTIPEAELPAWMSANGYAALEAWLTATAEGDGR